MKAIGCVIAYFKNHNNYGTSLQGFATIKAIEHEGYKCRLIQYQKSDSLFKKIRLAPLMFIMPRILISEQALIINGNPNIWILIAIYI